MLLLLLTAWMPLLLLTAWMLLLLLTAWMMLLLLTAWMLIAWMLTLLLTPWMLPMLVSTVQDYGLLLRTADPRTDEWLPATKMLHELDLASGATVDYKKRMRPLVIKLQDGGKKTQKTVMVRARICVRMCAPTCVRVCARVCMRECVHVFVSVHMPVYLGLCASVQG